jgi:transcriptional regulator with XRE-family HTH domain
MQIEKSIHRREYGLLLLILRERRGALKIPQEDLSAALGKSGTFVSKVEGAERRLDVLELISYVRALKIDPKIFLCHYLDAMDHMSSENVTDVI